MHPRNGLCLSVIGELSSTSSWYISRNGWMYVYREKSIMNIGSFNKLCYAPEKDLEKSGYPLKSFFKGLCPKRVAQLHL
ncbi:hypothetical protein MNV_1910004 [Candidatus Methanoperedens nitroreducens]|uniref:Uncharacterized protein n=1 Tax=Candidatus Methanoperedens nitratireducens TaxID=1392998 RepID=A0A284VMR5_9EURY|nr:hypothetical protein MNV_1910004 [Candidatus Methanoperedens nitroreducens]